MNCFSIDTGPVLVNQLVLSFGSRQIAYNISISFFFVCAILNGLIAFTLSADEEKVYSHLSKDSYTSV